MGLKSLLARTLGSDVHPRPPEPAVGLVEDAVRIEPLTKTDVASAVQLTVRVLQVRPGDRGEQFASDITDDRGQMFVAKANGQVVAYGRIAELAADEAGPGTSAGYYLSGVLVEPALRRRGIALALTRARLRWVFDRTDEVFYVAGADNIASLRLHAALGFQEVRRFGSGRSAAGVDVLSRLARTAYFDSGPLPIMSDPPRRHGNSHRCVTGRAAAGSRCAAGSPARRPGVGPGSQGVAGSLLTCR